MNSIVLSVLLPAYCLIFNVEIKAEIIETATTNNELFHIEGKVSIPFAVDQEWLSSTRVLIDGGKYLGFLRSDGSFELENIPSGSYVVEVLNAVYLFEPVRVDINSKGKLRARKLNYLQPSAVVTVPYPLKFKARMKTNYFQQREQWRITDFLLNPMVLMMVAPFLLILVLPKLMNTADPETQKEMQNQMNMFNSKQKLPDMSEMLAGWFGTSTSGSSATKKAVKAKAAKRR